MKDQHGAVIPGASVCLSNSEAQLALYASTGFDGQFKIDNLEAGVYKIRIEAPGSHREMEELYLSSQR